MPFPIGRSQIAYRPLYLRGLLMDGHYNLPLHPAPAPSAETAKTRTETCAKRESAVECKPLHGAAT